ncbi:MAG TPA: hypothetical protein VNW04_01225, partial [Puia sp.]|nr:hypothetical protein [Puia sp.]
MGVSLFGQLFRLLFGIAASVSVGVGPKATRHLRKLIRTDSSVMVFYDSVQRVADMALGEDPNPIDTLRTEGLLQGDPRKTATWNALNDVHKMYALALTWRVTGKQEYFDKTSI